MIVREYWPGFVDRSDPPREARIGVMLEALSIPWLQEKGELTIEGNVVLSGGLVVAVIISEGAECFRVDANPH